jgi:hypothetical protein
MATKPTNNRDELREAIINSLRQIGKWYWKPLKTAKTQARVSRGVYKCSCCGEEGPDKLPSLLPPKQGVKRRARNNAAVDHNDPVIDPAVGFVDWNTYIDRLFCDIDNLQVLCHECHRVKTNEENALRRKTKKDKK